MSTDAERRLELLTKLLQKLGSKGERGILIMVEGKKDLAALRELGIKGEILCVKSSNKVFADILDEVQSREVVLFVDFDDSGLALGKEITQYLGGKGVKVDSLLWRSFRSLLRKDVKDVEGVPSYLEKLKKQSSHS